MPGLQRNRVRNRFPPVPAQVGIGPPTFSRFEEPPHRDLDFERSDGLGVLRGTPRPQNGGPGRHDGGRQWWSAAAGIALAWARALCASLLSSAGPPFAAVASARSDSAGRAGCGAGDALPAGQRRPVRVMALLLAARDFKFLHRALRNAWLDPHVLQARAQGVRPRHLLRAHLFFAKRPRGIQPGRTRGGKPHGEQSHEGKHHRNTNEGDWIPGSDAEQKAGDEAG